MFIFKARARTEDLVRSIRAAISDRLKPDNANFRSRSSSAGNHGMNVIFSPSVLALQAADGFGEIRRGKHHTAPLAGRF